MSARQQLHDKGYTILAPVLSDAKLVAIEQQLALLDAGNAGTRNVLELAWCATLASQLKSHPQLLPLLPNNAVAVQCTYFNKSEHQNWLVPLHRDEFIPVQSRKDAAGWSRWSIKEGRHFVRPPDTVLASLVGVRIAIDTNGEHNGALNVVPDSHVFAEDSQHINGSRIACHVQRGGALVLKPLLLHASGKVRSGRRRVLHYLFGPEQLPDGLAWNSSF